jgi:hypothetical protein
VALLLPLTGGRSGPGRSSFASVAAAISPLLILAFGTLLLLVDHRRLIYVVWTLRTDRRSDRLGLLTGPQ